MPTYQYACTECGHDFEQVQSFSDDALEQCPVCSGRLRKVFTAVGVVFKGSGFYRTDNRSSTSASSSTTSTTSTTSSATSSSDSSGSSTSTGSSGSSGSTPTSSTAAAD